PHHAISSRSAARVVSVSFFFSSRRRHTRSKRDWSSDVCSSDLILNSAYSISFQPLIQYFRRDLHAPPVPAVLRLIIRSIRTLDRSEEHTSELQSRFDLVCRLLLEKKKTYLIV